MDIDRPYPPISAYGLIGNRHTCALVAPDGSIDWCCLPHLDSPSVFASLLDAKRGGYWQIAPVGEARATRRYLGPSAVLETTFHAAGGVLRLRDFLPIRQGRVGELSRSEHAVVRMVSCEEGEVELEMTWSPRPNYARADVTLTREGPLLRAHSRQGPLWLAGIPELLDLSLDDAAARVRMELRAGERLHLVCGWEEFADPPRPGDAERLLEETQRWWREWAEGCRIEEGAEEWRELILRSGMVLKILTHEKSGAIAAAPTTSLPEEIGGIRNWDYRFCWVRDASMITQAFATIGQIEDGVAFLKFLQKAAQQHGDPSRVQVLYGLEGETNVPEYNLGHLDGYRDSRPVRVGNAAALQRQLDVYGELIEAAYDLLRIGADIPLDQWAWLRGVADYVCTVWRLEDRGIWEVRGPPRHFTYSKLMCWVALDRSLKLAERLGWTMDTEHWQREREEIRNAILEQGFDPEINSFVQSFGEKILDASNLLIPMVGFLPADDPRVQGTIEATLRELTENGLVHRYHTDETPDGVGGGEGAFGICTFWLANALALSGRVEEAREVFGGMVAHANDLGLFSEEIDPKTGAFLGNFPQAFTHVGLINAAHYLGQALKPEGRHSPELEPVEPVSPRREPRQPPELERRTARG